MVLMPKSKICKRRDVPPNSSKIPRLHRAPVFYLDDFMFRCRCPVESLISDPETGFMPG